MYLEDHRYYESFRVLTRLLMMIIHEPSSRVQDILCGATSLWQEGFCISLAIEPETLWSWDKELESRVLE